MWFLALKQLLARKKQSVFILMGIILGTTAYVVISGVMLGFQQFLLDELINNMPQISISAKEQLVTPKLVTPHLFSENTLVKWTTPPSGVRELDYILNPQGWYHRLANSKDVLAYVPQADANVLMSHDSASRSVSIIGTLPEAQLKVTTIGNYITAGTFSSLKPGSNQIIVGSGLANKLGLTLNKMVNIVNQAGNIYPFKVSGIFKTGNKGTDDNTAYMALTDLQNLENKRGQINTIAVKVRHPYQASALAQHWQAFTQDKVESWQQTSANMLSVFHVQDFIRYFMVFAILLVSGFGIYNVLNIMINQKRREIAILRAIGYTARDVVQLFFIQGVLFGVLGGLIGITIGWLVCLYISTLPAVGQSADGGQATMVVAFNGSIYIFGILLALGAAIFASIIPAKAAGKLKPIAIIRSELSA
ncbi:MAG: FtsX-like permease family protein [Pseudomonadota bacterium]